jgi:hypothetical protein
MTWINWLFSFIHIPGTIAFLVWLYHHTITRNTALKSQPGQLRANEDYSPSGPALYETRRRTMAVCNLLAFVVFTLWPCMPPRLLRDSSIKGHPEGVIAKSFGFVDTLHGKAGAESVWTQNRFCNQHSKFCGLPPPPSQAVSVGFIPYSLLRACSPLTLASKCLHPAPVSLTLQSRSGALLCQHISIPPQVIHNVLC